MGNEFYDVNKLKEFAKTQVMMSYERYQSLLLMSEYNVQRVVPLTRLDLYFLASLSEQLSKKYVAHYLKVFADTIIIVINRDDVQMCEEYTCKILDLKQYYARPKKFIEEVIEKWNS